ncbi:MAG: hypothetical protein ACR2PK_14230 [Acidimicrobiales bacterium]
MELGEDIGRALSERHRKPADADPLGSVLNYTERPRSADWTMRSALVRLAQPEPGRVAEVLALSRRLDAVLGHVSRGLEKCTTMCDRRLTLSVLNGGHGEGAEFELSQPQDQYPDARVVDLARVCRAGPELCPSVLAGYSSLGSLSPEEAAAVPLLEVALRLDDLADLLVEWAIGAPGPAPVGQVDQTCGDVRFQLDELGVPTEEARPAGGRSRG